MAKQPSNLGVARNACVMLGVARVQVRRVVIVEDPRSRCRDQNLTTSRIELEKDFEPPPLAFRRLEEREYQIVPGFRN